MNNGDKPIIGILGGIGSGKSTVAAEFTKMGCAVIDADKIAHKALEDPGIKTKITDLFGRDIINPSGKIDRKKLAGIVFENASQLTLLNEIIHPVVIEHIEQLIKEYKQQNHIKAIVLDIPLLIEIGWAKRCSRIIFVDSNEKLRLERAKKLGYNKKQLKIREKYQISLDNKLKLADNIIENNSDFSALVRQIADILSDIINNG